MSIDTGGIRRWANDLQRIGRELWRDLKTLLRPGPRLVDQIEAVASVLLAILLAQLAGARNVGWAAFSGYMVIRSHLSTSMQRAALRVLGTLVGALAGYAMAIHVAGHPVWTSMALGLVVTGTMYMVLVSRRTYAWLFTGLTFLMIVADTLGAQELPPRAYAISRVVEILVGTGASLLVSLVSSCTLRRWVPGQLPKPATSYRGWHGAAAWHALQAGVAAMLIPCFAHWIAMPTLTQAGVTVMAVMAVPLASVEAPGNMVSTRMVHRFLGCSLGGLLAMGILLVCHHDPVLITLGLCAGVAIGRHIENGAHKLGYVGVQFALAFLVVLVPDHYANASIQPGLERLAGIMLGFVLLLLARAVFMAGRTQLPRLLGRGSS
ncbi:FUSC family protein [Dyella sp. C9]|uniref:FUSC family protein n=1 Tax=Dyella sp. C9 TaxID=2202154 RepID=UPI001E4E9831|nr:FUSC family protein [Dyella sp. C9]